MSSDYPKRYVANILIEAVAPFKVGSSSIDMIQDAPVQKDWNGLPMILGTSIAGVLRKEFEEKFANDIFGDEDSQKKESKGSRIIISNALLCKEDMEVIESLGIPEKEKNFLDHYETLPLREHVKITHQGVADTNETAKYDEEVVYAGSRFRFRVEFVANESDDNNWTKLLETINSKTFRLGGGTTKGFGEVKVIADKSTYQLFDLDSDEYRKKSSSLNTTFSEAFNFEEKVSTHTVYTLKIEPDDFFMFGSGFGEDDIKMIPVKEKIVTWDDNKGKFSDEQILMPASSVKGALSHRTAFYYNKEMMKQEGYEPKVGEENDAVVALFGHKKEILDEVELGQKGKILISDCFKVDKKKVKVFDHVSIDRFTGGSIDSALFNEQTIAQKDKWEVEILVEESLTDTEYVKAFENALGDVCKGMLALGGATTKGHGVFCGTLEKDGDVIADGGCSNEQ